MSEFKKTHLVIFNNFFFDQLFTQWIMWLYPYTMIITQIYFFIFGVLTYRYAKKSRNYPEKKGHPEYFKNEMIVALMYFILTIIYPWIFHTHIENELVRHQCCFHVWNSSTVQFLIWPIYLHFAKKNNKKNDVNTDFQDWKKKVREKYKERDEVKADLNRKLMHLIPPGVVIGLYYLGYALDGISMAGVEWGYESLAVFWPISVAFAFGFMMLIADLLRLNHFEKLGLFARNWAEDMIIPKELNTFTSSNVMILAYIPFYFAPFKIVFSIVVISAVSDAAASIFGKKFGKNRNKNDPKTREGYIAGFITTYLVVVGLNYIMNLTEPSSSLLEIQFMALAAAIAFYLVDRYARQISDNFLNPIATGIAMTLVYFVF